MPKLPSSKRIFSFLRAFNTHTHRSNNVFPPIACPHTCHRELIERVRQLNEAERLQLARTHTEALFSSVGRSLTSGISRVQRVFSSDAPPPPTGIDTGGKTDKQQQQQQQSLSFVTLGAVDIESGSQQQQEQQEQQVAGVASDEDSQSHPVKVKPSDGSSNNSNNSSKSSSNLLKKVAKGVQVEPIPYPVPH